MKADLNLCFKLLNSNFSLITVSEDKIPNIKWKDYQIKKMSNDAFENFYKMPNTAGVGIVTGYEGLEVLDIDLKVLPTVTERNDFFKQLISLCKDNIFDFEKKFVIVKTRNSGYHILYKCKNPTGNKKIATLENHKEAIIESRGIGGYVWIYSEFVQLNNYSDIQFISDEDREILWSCAKIFNHEKLNESEHHDLKKEYYESDITPWKDYNEKTPIFDLIRNEFTIVRKVSGKTIIRRNGAKSPHSGYVYDNSNCMFLFSTGTQYPNEKLLSPFAIFAINNHNSDFKAAANDLYSRGFGSRIKKKQPQLKKINDVETIITTDFPLSIFPEHISNYILEINKSLNGSIDYLGSAMLWLLSVCIGNSIKVEVKKGWTEAAVIWIAIVGRAGVGKTHTLNSIINPLHKINEREIKRYNDQLKKYDEYMALDKKEKQFAEEIKKPVKNQFIVGDITIEAMFEHHESNKNAIGIFRDELSGWIKDLNKYRPGSDLETYLSCWSNQHIILNRKTSKGAYISNAFVPIIGGVQPSILSNHYTDENKDNGFIDRILICYPDINVSEYNHSEMNESLINWYDEYIIGLYDFIKNNCVIYDDYGNVKPNYIRFSEDAYIEWVRIFNKITAIENSDNENEYMKSILPKQKSYVIRFSLLLEVLDSYDKDFNSKFEITKKSILSAEKLSDYFILMAKKNKVDSLENKEIKDTIKKSGKTSSKDKFISILESGVKINKSKIAIELNISRVTLNKWENEYNISSVSK